MLAASTRFGRTYLPLVVRSVVLLVCALTTLMFQLYRFGAVNNTEAVLPAILLLGVAALASLPLPTAVPPYLPLLAETLAAGLVVGLIGEEGLVYLLYPLIPIFLAGLSSGVVAGLGCGIAALVTLVAATAAAQQQIVERNPTLFAPWVLLLLTVGPLGAWIRRIRMFSTPDSEPAYADAHRLLSELHVVARQLSLGLDPRTLAAALADDVRSIVPYGDAGVLARSAGGRFLTLVGDEPPAEAEPVVKDAWISARPTQRRIDDSSVSVIPVQMGERVVALVVLVTADAIDGAALDRAHAVVAQSGPRLASAILFDDVRRLATVDERMRLAREIHDGIAQDLASVGYALDDIRRDSGDDVARRVTAVREQLRSMVADLRLSIFDLRSSIDDSVSLGTALSEYVPRVGSQSGLVVHMSIDESPRRLPIAVEVELLRMVQEAIHNVRKHARASNLWLTVTVEPPNAHISVTDDGSGLRPGRADSFGIAGMRERARRIGATLHVGPGAESGTVVEIGLGTEIIGVQHRRIIPAAVSREALTDPRGLTLPAMTSQTEPVEARVNQEVTP